MVTVSRHRGGRQERDEVRSVAKVEEMPFNAAISGLDSQPGRSSPDGEQEGQMVGPSSHGFGLNEAQWAMDLSLMHHYCTNTADTLTTRKDSLHVYRVLYPQEGRRHPFVFHGILGFAALHKAYLSPNERGVFLDASAHHQSLGLGMFNALLSSLSGDLQGQEGRGTIAPWRPLLCFTTLVVTSVCARASIDPPPSPINDTLELFDVVRGIRTVVGPRMQNVERSDFAPLAVGVWRDESIDGSRESLERRDNVEIPTTSCLPQDTIIKLESLRAWIIQRLTPDSTIPSERVEALVQALDELHTCVRHVIASGGEPEVGVLVMWPYSVPHDFLIEMRSGSPLALILLAYWAAFFSLMEERFWFVRGWGRTLISEIEEKLRGYACVVWLAWPLGVSNNGVKKDSFKREFDGSWADKYVRP
ncbi:hypothetical protein ACJ41O_014728 [Fusarium nematophilum]